MKKFLQKIQKKIIMSTLMMAGRETSILVPHSGHVIVYFLFSIADETHPFLAIIT